jgi:uncharacterized protein (TIGR02246 family)
MSSHPLRSVIEAADRAIVAENFDALMDVYADDATLVIRPGLNATGKAEIRRAFVAIAEHFNHSLALDQGDMVVLEGADAALVIMESIIEAVGADGARQHIVRRGTAVFRKDPAGQWLCVIDNSYGTDLLGAV